MELNQCCKCTLCMQTVTYQAHLSRPLSICLLIYSSIIMEITLYSHTQRYTLSFVNDWRIFHYEFIVVDLLSHLLPAFAIIQQGCLELALSVHL